ncbi:MAG TPA: EAL domain-containing protein [Solirubrobacteraceae bacterium]|nr:EAL domain-containing protein [Solirubrobacteraceae bacterium]
MPNPTSPTRPRALQRIIDWLPRGRTLPDAEWAARHRAMLWILWLHVVALPVFLAAQGFDAWGSIGPVIPVALAGVGGTLSRADRRARSVAVVFGLLTASAVLVYGWHGQTEAHFHYFVMIALLALYEDWLPFGLAIAYVALEHGVGGALASDVVFSHHDNSWLWAGVHSGFVLAAAAAAVTTWRLNENTRTRMTEAYREARATEERFRVAFASGVSGMSIEAPDGHFLEVNQALCAMLGYTEQEILGRSFAELRHPGDAGSAPADDDRDEGYEREERYVRSDGETVWVRRSVRPVRDEHGRTEFFVSQTSDVTMRKRAEDELAHHALHDALTGVPNRTLFLDRLDHALRRLATEPGQLAVLFVDLDRFKLVNDSMGHSAGDTVLQETARRLAEAVRAGDTLARFGGDEFTVLCEGAGELEGCQVAARVLRALTVPFVLEGRSFELGATVGIRVNDRPDVAPQDLLHDADVALYEAKRLGRGSVEIFDPARHTHHSDLLRAEHTLRGAIRDGELVLHYQPEVDLRDGVITAVEALVRWERPGHGTVAPAQFITLAEDSGLIVEMGAWVLGEACRQLAAWRTAGLVGPGFRVAVNVSGRQLSEGVLQDDVADALRDAGLEPSSLCLEITESALVQNLDIALPALQRLKTTGVAIALDDFGVGFSSLSRIRELPAIDVIKIDRSFTAGFPADRRDAAVVSAVISLATRLGVSVIAEGIETEIQHRALFELGCLTGQGFLFARPLAPDALADLLAAQARPRLSGPEGDAAPAAHV